MINVKVKNNPVRVSVTSNPSVVSQVKNYVPQDLMNNMSLRRLTDVDATDSDNNETLVYDETTNKFIVKTLPIVQGGTF